MEKYTTIQGIKTKDNEIIPIWDNRVQYIKDDYYGNHVIIEGDRTIYSYFTECIYNLKTKEISIGIEINYYPDKPEFSKGQEVCFEKSHKVMTKSTIKDIVYEEYDLDIQKGKKINGWYRKLISDEDFNPESLYAIKTWKPYYLMEDDTIIKWEHQIYKVDKTNK